MIFDNEDEEEGDEDDDSDEENDEEDLEDAMDDEEYDESDAEEDQSDGEGEPDDMIVGAARWKKNIANKAKESFIQRQLNAKNLHSVSFICYNEVKICLRESSQT